MTDYRRFYSPGSTGFFPVNMAEWRDNHLLVERIDALRAAFRYARQRQPFRLDIVVIMPDHRHCIWPLPPGAADFSKRWSLLKSHFSRALPKAERIS